MCWMTHHLISLALAGTDVILFLLPSAGLQCRRRRSIDLNVLQTALTGSGTLSVPQLRFRDMEELEADIQEVVRLLNNTSRNVTRRCLLQLLSNLQTVKTFIPAVYSLTAGGLCSQVFYAYTRIAVVTALLRIPSALLCRFQGLRCHLISCVLYTDY